MARGDSEDRRYTRHEGRRQEILAAAVQYVFTHGLSDLSMRPMAEALGMSHRTLLHHFGSKEELISRVLREIRKQQMSGMQDWPQATGSDPLALLERAWKHYTSDEFLNVLRVYFEVYAIALQKPAQYAEFFDGLIEQWLVAMAAPMIASGVPKTKARILATLVMGWVRGVLIDLLTTGERKRVEASYAMLREMLKQELALLRAGAAPRA